VGAATIARRPGLDDLAGGRTPVSERTTEAAADPRERAVDSAALFAGRREIVIRHAGSEYRLRITRSDKLILTK